MFISRLTNDTVRNIGKSTKKSSVHTPWQDKTEEIGKLIEEANVKRSQESLKKLVCLDSFLYHTR